MNDDEFSQYAPSTMRSIMGDTDITQWEWLIEFRGSVPYTNLHLGFDMRKHIPSPYFLATNSSTALCGERLRCRICHIEGEIWLCDRCITHGERAKVTVQNRRTEEGNPRRLEEQA